MNVMTGMQSLMQVYIHGNRHMKQMYHEKNVTEYRVHMLFKLNSTYSGFTLQKQYLFCFKRRNSGQKNKNWEIKKDHVI